MDILVVAENCFSINYPEVDSDLSCSEAMQQFLESTQTAICDFVAFYSYGVYPEGCTAQIS